MTIQPSPLTSAIPAATSSIVIEPLFGGQLRVSFRRLMGAAIQMNGTVSAITVHGDGRVEYHLTTSEE